AVGWVETLAFELLPHAASTTTSPANNTSDRRTTSTPKVPGGKARSPYFGPRLVLRIERRLPRRKIERGIPLCRHTEKFLGPDRMPRLRKAEHLELARCAFADELRPVRVR